MRPATLRAIADAAEAVQEAADKVQLDKEFEPDTARLLSAQLRRLAAEVLEVGRR